MKHLFTLCALAMISAGFCQVPQYIPTEGLVAWYPFNGSASDETGDGNDGVVYGAFLASDRFGNDSCAYVFDGTDDYILIENSTSLEFEGSDFTFSGWFNTSVSKRQWIVSNYLTYGNNPLWMLGIPHDGILNHLGIDVRDGINAIGQSITDSEVVDGSWHHSCFIRNGETIEVYLDGLSILSLDVPTLSFLTEGNPYYIGTDNLNFQCWEGAIDDIGFWNRSLNPAEILGLFVSGPLVAGCTDAAACNFDSEANEDDGSCDFGCNYCGPGTVWDELSLSCLPLVNPSDLNSDGCVDVQDFLGHLAAFGEGCNGNSQTSPWQCGDPLEHQGYAYETVQIGEQCWFAENCRYLPYLNEVGDGSDVDPRYYVLYEDHTDLLQAQESPSCMEYGALYNLPAVLVGEELCPSGWHIPNIQEWEELGAFASDLGPNSLKHESWGGGASGFDAKAAGHRADYGDYIREFEESDFWSITIEPNCVNHVARLMSDEVDLMTSDLMFHCDSGNSVRCIQDSE